MYDRFEPTSGDGSRPCILYLYEARDITVAGISLQNTTDWNLHIIKSDSVVIDGLYIYGDSRFPNNDGIDPDSSTNVQILNTVVNVADDGICPKSSIGEGPLRDILVSNCTIRSKSHAIKFGSNTDTDMFNMVFENITIWDSNSGMAIQQRSGGNIHNITFRNIHIQTRYESPRWWGNGEWLVITAEPRNPGDVIGRTYDLHFEDITAVSENGALISGIAHGVQNITFSRVNVTIDRWSNYSSGAGPKCADSAGALMDCMGTQDHRPSTSYQDCGYTCRTPGLAHGMYFENVQTVELHEVSIEFKPQEGGRPSYFGQCIAHDSQSRNIQGTVDCKL